MPRIEYLLAFKGRELLRETTLFKDREVVLIGRHPDNHIHVSPALAGSDEELRDRIAQVSLVHGKIKWSALKKNPDVFDGGSYEHRGKEKALVTIATRDDRLEHSTLERGGRQKFRLRPSVIIMLRPGLVLTIRKLEEERGEKTRVAR